MRQHEQGFALHHAKGPFVVETEPQPHQYNDYPQSIPLHGGEASTYYSGDMTRTTKRTKKTEASDAGCSVWDTISKNFGYALAKTCGIKNSAAGRDDGSSISSAPSLEEKVRGSSMKHNRSKSSKRRSGGQKDPQRDVHYQQQQQQQKYHNQQEQQGQYNHAGSSVPMTTTTPNSHMRAFV
jgi:hypothetical protein